MKFYFNSDSNATHFQYDVEDIHHGIVQLVGAHVEVEDDSVVNPDTIELLAQRYGGELLEETG